MTRRRETLANWSKSSYSAVNGDCVEVKSDAPARVQVRDSKAVAGHVLAFRTGAWSAFLHGLGAENS